jgi:hypothetical protein
VGKIKSKNMELSNLSATKVFAQFDIKPTLKMKCGSFLKEWEQCPYDILPSKIKRVANFHVLLCEMEKCACARIGDAEAEKKKLKEKLLGFWFIMEDRKAIALEAQDSITTLE